VGGGGAGAGLGAAVVYAASRLGANLTSEDGALIAATAITVGAFVAHNGIRGCARLIWRGAESTASPTPTA